MTLPRLACLLAAPLVTMLPVVACGEEGAAPAPTVTKSDRPAPEARQKQALSDPPGDVLDKPATRVRTVSRKQLDLLRVSLTRSGGRLTVRFETAAPPGEGMVQVLETYDRRLVTEGRIEIRYRRGGAIRALARKPGGTFKPVRADVSARDAVVRAPLDDHTEEREFKWRAYTVSTAPTHEIRDRVPTRPGDYAIFPGGLD